MKKSFIILLIALFHGIIYSQNDNFEYYTEDSQETVRASLNDSLTTKTKKMSLGVETGFAIGNGYSAYIAPHVSYRATDKITINVGTILGNSYYANSYFSSTDEELYANNSKTAMRMFYAQGEYRYSEKLTVRSTVVYERNPSRDIDGTSVHQDFKQVSVGVDYKITPNITIGVEVRRSEGYSPYYYSPFYTRSTPYNIYPFRQF